MPFSSMHNDEVSVQSTDGAKSANYKTHIGGAKDGHHSATIFDKDFIGQEGWILSRILPGGREEKYLIVQADFSPGLHSIPPHWNLKLKKGSSFSQMQEDLRTKQAPVININNSQGIQIGDHNIQHIASSLQGLIEKIDQSSAPEYERQEAKNLLAQLLDNPTVASILGGAVGGVIGLLK